MSITQTRKKYIDYAKGVGIILMVMGHIGFGWCFDVWIHTFHMPLFFILSGLLFKDAVNLKVHIKKRIRTLLVPYFIFGGGYSLISIVTVGHLDTEKVMHLLWENTSPLPITSVLWFFTAMFIGDNIFYIIMATLKNQYVRFFACSCVSIIGFGAAHFLPVRLPWALDAGLVGVIFFYIGYWINQQNVFIRLAKCNILQMILLIGILGLNSVIAFTNGMVNMREGIYGNIFVFILVACVFSFITIYFCRIIENSAMQCCVFEYLSFIGRNSVVFLCVNQPVISFVNKVLSALKINIAHSNIVTLCVTMVIISVIASVFRFKPFKFMIGG